MNRECCECCVRKNKIIDKIQLQMDKLQKNSDAWSRRHWELVGENCKLLDKLQTLHSVDIDIIKKVLM